MTHAEREFKIIVHGLVAVGIYPSPTMIRARQQPPYSGASWPRSQMNNLNGRECTWREEVLEELGWVHARTGPGGRSWDPPESWEEAV